MSFGGSVGLDEAARLEIGVFFNWVFLEEFWWEYTRTNFQLENAQLISYEEPEF